MLVPEGYVVSMYLATCGAGGNLQGSDEKEIVYLVYGIIDVQTKEVRRSSLIDFAGIMNLKNVSFKFPLQRGLENAFNERWGSFINYVTRRIRPQAPFVSEFTRFFYYKTLNIGHELFFKRHVIFERSLRDFKTENSHGRPL